MSTDKFKSIDDLNKILSNVNGLVYPYINGISEIEDLSQDIIDDCCTRISEKINKELDEKRTSLINNLTKAYTATLGIVQELGVFFDEKGNLISLNTITKLDEAVNTINKIIPLFNSVLNFIAGPYKIAIEFVTILTPKLEELTENINKLADLKNNLPELKGFNLNKLDIHISPININDIIGGSTDNQD